MRIRLDISYDGSHFRGWARQPHQRTVQGTIEGAIARVLGGDPRLVVAGRTDAGVHATGQVAHLDLDAGQLARLTSSRRRREPDDEPRDDAHDDAHDDVTALARRIRGVLGAYPDLSVTRTTVAPEGFDARFSAVWRRYQYRLADDLVAYDPLERHRTTIVRGRLDVAAMDAAASALRGLHDFAAYCKPREEATTIRTLFDFEWVREASGVLIATLRADAFCHSMVRALVGGCAAVGQGRLRVEDLVRIRDDLIRVPEVKVLAARGLTLTAVGYPANELLGQRASQTRARRDLDAD